MYKKSNRIICMGLMLCMTSAMVLGGCGQKSENSGKIEIELVQYKPEAVKTFEKIEEEFNATHDDIHLTIESPNDAMTVLKTRFIREDAPDIIGIGGDVNFSNFIDSDMLMDISDYEGLDSIKQAYLDIDKRLNLYRRMACMPFHMWQMQQEFCTTEQCLRNMAGKFRKPGMNL